MSRKYFFVSDIHSHYTPLVTALHENGFDENNQDHILCVLGDVFDRGKETLQLYNYLTSLPKERLILIRGNHELLYNQLLNDVFPRKGDFDNGTVRTFCQIAGVDERYIDTHYWIVQAVVEGVSSKELSKYIKAPSNYWKQVIERVAQSEITQWINSNDWVNYLETPHYIFVHSFIPLQQRLIDARHVEDVGFREDWRNATQTEWEDAMWGCPWSAFKMGWNQTGKTIVCGHWSTDDFFKNLTTKASKEDIKKCNLFKSTKYNVIALDAATVATGRINVLVLDEDEL